YSSGHGNGPFGIGWSLSVPGITRQTAKGIPQYDDTRDIFVLSGAEDLVPVNQSAAITSYRPRTEGLFALIQHHRDADNDYWEVKTRDGLVSLYGTPKSSGSDPAVIADPDRKENIFAWKLTRTIDTFGNLIEYVYQRDAQQTEDVHHWDQLYLSEIRYANYGDPQSTPGAPKFLVTVNFTYLDRPDHFSDYRPGFEIRTAQRCSRIDISTHAEFDALTRTYQLIYLDDRGPSAQLPRNGVSALSQIKVVGHDGDLQEELPPLEFAYSLFEPERRHFFPLTGSDLPLASLANHDFEMVDLFGNGLPDMLQMNSVTRYWRNLGGGVFDLPREMRDAPAGFHLTDPGVQLIDANGDGRPDLLINGEGLAGYFPLQFGGLWNRKSFQRYRQAPSFVFGDPEVRLVDLDGDGVTDAVRSGSRFEYFFNDREQGWNRTSWAERQSLSIFPNLNFSDARVKWADMSGDGLQDIVLVYDGCVEYWPNRGYGHWGKQIHMKNSPRFPLGYDPKRILIGDVDGDGLADLVYIDDTRVTLWINQSGNSWSDAIVIQGTPPVTDMDAVRLVDLLGTGVSGVLWSADRNGPSRQNMFFLDFTGGTKPYLLNEMNNHIGAVTRVQYAPSTRFYIEDQKRTQTRWRSPLPFPVHVVALVETIDQISSTRLTTEYRYHHGYWDGAEREFRGFGMVEQFDSETSGPAPQVPGSVATLYNFSTIDFPGAPSTLLLGINSNRQLVGLQRDANGARHSALIGPDSSSSFDPPGFGVTTFPGTSAASAINDNDEVVGVVFNSDGSGYQAFSKLGERFSFYSHPLAGSGKSSRGTEFTGLNNFGARVGTYSDNNDLLHGFIQVGELTTQLEDDPRVPANSSTFIADINNLNQIVGGYFDPTGEIQHGFFRDKDAFITIDFPGSSITWLNGINDLGQMVGSYFDDATQKFHGFLTDGVNFRVLDSPDEAGQPVETFLTSIDNLGRVVGYYADSLNSINRAGIHGLLATPVASNQALLATAGQNHFSPPVLTKTWFHQGPVGEEFGDWEELDLSSEFFADDPELLQHKQGIDTFLRTLTSRRARRDAIRALRGNILRTELYALDNSERAGRPYTVTEYSYGLREESPPDSVDSARLHIFFPHLLAQRTTRWERGNDPLVQFSFTDDYDEFGQPRRQTQVACPRGWRSLGDKPAQPYLATQMRTTFARPQDQNVYIFNRIARTTSLELKNDGVFTINDLRSLAANDPSFAVIGQTYNYYDGPAFEGLAAGRIDNHGALVRSEGLVLTETLLHDAYKSGDALINPPEEPPYLTLDTTVPWTSEYPAEFRNLVPQLAGYVFHAGGPDQEDVAGFFTQSERCRYDFQEASASKVARGLRIVSRDPLGHDTATVYDKFDLLPVRVTNPAQLATQIDYDYRAFQPKLVTDPNGNINLFRFTPLGLLRETLVQGKNGEGDASAPSVSMTYNFLAFMNSMQPISVHTTRRIHHDRDSDVPSPERDETIESREYSDGFGRLVQVRSQAEDLLFGDPVFGAGVLPADQNNASGTALAVSGRQRGPNDLPNVVVSGWQIYDNKGRVIQKYEPFSSAGYDYAELKDFEFGQRVELFYDPRGQLIRTVNPDTSERKVVLGVPGTIAAPDFSNPDVFEPTPWEIYTYDQNDNAGRTHAGTAASYRSHWNTPTSVQIDCLGRTVISIERTRDAGDPLPPLREIRTTSRYDIRGNLLQVIDALGRVAFTHTYDLLNRLLRVENIDAGIRRNVLDAAGNPIEGRDSKGALALHAYDVLNRPTHLWARDASTEVITLRERNVYGDDPNASLSAAQIAAGNLLGRPYRIYDEAGRVTFERYDFQGNLTEKVRQVIGDGVLLAVFTPPVSNIQTIRVDWSLNGAPNLEVRATALLDPTEYRTSTSFDALSRVRLLSYPQDVAGTRKQLQPRYNRAGALESVSLDNAIYVAHVAYNAKAQRLLIAYGNGLLTRYAYDTRTFRLQRLRTERCTQPSPSTFSPDGPALQDFGYGFDLVGNIGRITDRAPASGIPNTPLGPDALNRDFNYDPLYRLLAANGRECDVPPELPWDDTPRCTDLTRTRAYSETYRYDDVGNLTQLSHTANRIFAFVPNSNRLATLTIGQTAFAYTYDANGNLISETSSRHFEWDHSDRLRAYRTQVDQAEPSVHAQYLYDSAGQRVKKLVRRQGGQVETTTYLEGIFEHHRIVQGGVTQENNSLHVMDNQSRIALVQIGQPFPDDSSPMVKYQLGDHLGSSNVVLGGATTESADFISREEFTPYGETSFGSFARKRYRFTSKERDTESGLYYHGARYYGCWLLRWISPDPLAILAHGNKASSPFCYASNNPIRLVDPTGLDDVKAEPGTASAKKDQVDPTVAQTPGTNTQAAANQNQGSLTIHSSAGINGGGVIRGGYVSDQRGTQRGLQGTVGLWGDGSNHFELSPSLSTIETRIKSYNAETTPSYSMTAHGWHEYDREAYGLYLSAGSIAGQATKGNSTLAASGVLAYDYRFGDKSRPALVLTLNLGLTYLMSTQFGAPLGQQTYGENTFVPSGAISITGNYYYYTDSNGKKINVPLATGYIELYGSSSLRSTAYTNEEGKPTDLSGHVGTIGFGIGGSFNFRIGEKSFLTVGAAVGGYDQTHHVGSELSTTSPGFGMLIMGLTVPMF
ncbi:MAG TPA: SpvB/TcaC N-terminal domain-containing protein, partial [Pyrinomonadaceae bacterium]|nr:SpvB/TcaC N-terminal domain-containing protein [Pyrinomonadaceae bacterium]